MTERIGVREYSRRIGVSHVAVLNAIKSGRLNKSIIRNEKGQPRIDPKAADAEWGINTDPDKQRNTEGAGGRAAAPPPKGQAMLPGVEAPSTAPRTEVGAFGGKTVAQWRAAQLAIATKNDELDLALRQGRLADVEKVKAKWFQLVRETRDRLLNIPDRLAGELAAETDLKRVHAALDREIRLALSELTTDGGPGK